MPEKIKNAVGEAVYEISRSEIIHSAIVTRAVTIRSAAAALSTLTSDTCPKIAAVAAAFPFS
jgi:hypothetical protein